jgi:hypothetical protein
MPTKITSLTDSALQQSIVPEVQEHSIYNTLALRAPSCGSGTWIMKINDKSAMTTVEIAFIRWAPKMCVKGMKEEQSQSGKT